MKNYRIFTCLLAMLLACMIGTSAFAETDLSGLEAAVKAAETALALAQSKVESLGSVENDSGVKAAKDLLANKKAELALKQSAIDTNASEIADVKAQLKDIKATIDAELVALDAQKDKLEAGKNNPDNAPAALDAAIEAAEKAAADAKAEADKITAKQEAVKAAKANQEATAKNLEEQQTALDAAKKETQAAKDAIPAAEQALESAKSILSTAEATFSEEKASYKAELEAALKKAEDYLAELEGKVAEGGFAGLGAQALIPAAKATIEYAKSDIDQIDSLFVSLNAGLKEAVDQAQAGVATAEAELEQAKQDVLDAETAQATAQEKLDTATTANAQALADITVAEKALEDQQKAAADMQKKAQDKADELQALKDSNANKAELQAAAEKLYDDFMATYEAKKAEINAKDATLEAELAALEAEKAQLAADAEAIAAAIPALEKAVEDAKAAFNEKKAGLDAALTKAKDILAAAEKALEDAKDAIQDAVDNGVCTHNSMKLSAFGSNFCVLKALGNCNHGDCCANISTGTITNTIKGYIQSGDFQGLKSEAQNLYNQLGALQGSPVESLVRGMIESATNAKANEYLGAEKWAELKNLANQMMSAGELNGMIDGVVADLKGQVDSAINAALNGNPAALNALKAKIDELKSYFGNIDLDKVEIDAALVQRAKNILNSAKAEIEAMINAANDKIDREKIEAAINNAVAALRNVNHAEIKAAIEQFVSELKAKLEDKFSDAVSQGKAELEALIQSALNSDCAQHISNKVAALKAAVEAKLANIHVCEESAEVVAQEVKALIEACEADILSYLQQKADDLCGKLPNIGLNESEVKALIAKAISALKELAESKLNSLQNVIREILGHTRIVLPAEAPTCGAPGLTEGLKCVCGYVIIAQEPIPATGNHQYVNGECACGAKDPNYVTPEKPTDPAPSVKPDPTPTPTPPAPPVVTPKPPVVTPEPPVVTPEIPVIPPMKLEYYYNNTMSGYGPTTRELVGGKDWYRVTPVDLSIDGVYTYDLIASNRYVIGTVTIKVEAGELTVSYDVEARPCTVKKEALKIYASKADLAVGNAIEAKVGEPLNATENFGSDTKVLVSLILTGDYATNGYNVTDMVINKAEIAAMIANMD